MDVLVNTLFWNQSLILGDCELWEGELPPLKIRCGGPKTRGRGAGLGGGGDREKGVLKSDIAQVGERMYSHGEGNFQHLLFSLNDVFPSVVSNYSRDIAPGYIDPVISQMQKETTITSSKHSLTYNLLHFPSNVPAPIPPPLNLKMKGPLQREESWVLLWVSCSQISLN